MKHFNLFKCIGIVCIHSNQEFLSSDDRIRWPFILSIPADATGFHSYPVMEYSPGWGYKAHNPAYLERTVSYTYYSR